MKTILLFAFLACAFLAHAQDNAPMVFPARGEGKAISKFGNSVIAQAQTGPGTITTTFGVGFLTRGSTGTTPVNNPASSNGTIIRVRQ